MPSQAAKYNLYRTDFVMLLQKNKCDIISNKLFIHASLNIPSCCVADKSIIYFLSAIVNHPPNFIASDGIIKAIRFLRSVYMPFGQILLF